jgi:hypothetical protein
VPVPDTGQDEEQETADVLLADPPSDERVRRIERQEDEPPRRPAREPYQKPVRGDWSDSEPVVKKPRRKKAERREGVVFERGWFGSLNAGMVGGLLMMLIAVVWFVVGLAVGFIFFYPPIFVCDRLYCTGQGANQPRLIPMADPESALIGMCGIS